MTALTDIAENQTLNWLTGQGSPNVPVPPVLPLRVALVTALGNDATPGTEVTGAGYTRQSGTFGPSVAGQSANTNLIRYDNLPDIPAPGVVGFEIWDSGGSPRRWWWAAVTTPRTYAAGDAAEFPPGELVLAAE